MGNMGQILAQWQHPVVSMVALDLVDALGIAPGQRYGHQNVSSLVGQKGDTL